MNNSGSQGIKIDGSINNKNGSAKINNEAGLLVVNGAVSNSGPKLSLLNRGEGIRVNENAL